MLNARMGGRRRQENFSYWRSGYFFLILISYQVFQRKIIFPFYWVWTCDKGHGRAPETRLFFLSAENKKTEIGPFSRFFYMLILLRLSREKMLDTTHPN